MLVAFHSPPLGFFKSAPPHGANELLGLVEKASQWGFRGFQTGPTTSFTHIDAHRLKTVLDNKAMERSVHVGGLYNAKKFVMSHQERNRVQKDLRAGIELSKEIASPLVSFHPPFFKVKKSDALSSRAKLLFLELLKEEADYARSSGMRMALESFCYPPFIFNDLNDLKQFVSYFSSAELGVLLEVGHLYQAKCNLDEAIQVFGDRIFDVHVHDATLYEDFKKATHLPLGTGNIDFLDMINSLRKVKYDGWLTLEIHGNEKEILESKKLLENLINVSGD